MIPRTSNATAYDEPVDEWRVVVAAIGVDGESLGAGAHQQNWLPTDMTEELAVGKL